MAEAPLAIVELVCGQRPADRLVVGDEPLLHRVELAEGELRRRRGDVPPRTVAAAGEQCRREERRDTPVDSAAMRVLVTGASGFVGSALVEELRHGERAYEVHPLGRDDGDLADDGV